MGQSLLFLVARGPKCAALLCNIHVLRGWSKSTIGIGSSNCVCLTPVGCCLIRLEWMVLSRCMLTPGCWRFSIRVRICSNCSNCWSIAWPCSNGRLKVPVWMVAAFVVWFQFWTSVLKPLGADGVEKSGRKASGSLKRRAMAMWALRW